MRWDPMRPGSLVVRGPEMDEWHLRVSRLMILIRLPLTVARAELFGPKESGSERVDAKKERLTD
jgi:hypothetical protein